MIPNRTVQITDDNNRVRNEWFEYLRDAAHFKAFIPTDSSDPRGVPGDIAADSNYLYIRLKTGWRRVALGSF